MGSASPCSVMIRTGTRFPRGSDRIRDQVSKPSLRHRVLIREEAGQRVREGFFKIFPPDVTVPDEAAREYFSFLLEVTALVFQFLTLIPMQQAMIAEGVHSRRIFGSGVSVDMARFMPEALVGRLSGIKIYFQDGRKGRTLKLKYVSFASVPRLLL